jgi:SSS family solute:Na+ symporter/sodium/proline symporter
MAPNIGAVAMLASLVVVPVVSLLSAKMPSKHIEKVFGENKAVNTSVEG